MAWCTPYCKTLLGNELYMELIWAERDSCKRVNTKIWTPQISIKLQSLLSILSSLICSTVWETKCICIIWEPIWLMKWKISIWEPTKKWPCWNLICIIIIIGGRNPRKNLWPVNSNWWWVLMIIVLVVWTEESWDSIKWMAWIIR